MIYLKSLLMVIKVGVKDDCRRCMFGSFDNSFENFILKLIFTSLSVSDRATRHDARTNLQDSATGEAVI